MSPFLKNVDAGKALGVDVRTIKRWMQRPATREALLAVRRGRQWRIPRPDDLAHWRGDTRWRLRKLGIQLAPAWRRDLRKIARKTGPHWLESIRLWLAANLTALERGRITQRAKQRIALLRQATGKFLAPLRRYDLQVDKLKCKVSDQLQALGLPDKEARAVMRCWPTKKHFDQVRTAHTYNELEAIRKRLDYAQAVRVVNRRGQRPTAENLCPLVHDSMLAHINDTGEDLPAGCVIKAPTPEQMRRIALGSALAAANTSPGKKLPVVILDFRQPQTGLRLRRFRKRHPRKQQPQRDIVASEYRVSSSLPSADEKPHSGKTPIRKAIYSQAEEEG